MDASLWGAVIVAPVLFCYQLTITQYVSRVQKEENNCTLQQIIKQKWKTICLWSIDKWRMDILR